MSKTKISCTATEFKNRVGEFLTKAIKEPVVISKSGKPFAVVVSFEDFEKLKLADEHVQDQFLLEKALKAKKEKSLSPKETMVFFQSIARKGKIKKEKS